MSQKPGFPSLSVYYITDEQIIQVEIKKQSHAEKQTKSGEGVTGQPTNGQKDYKKISLGWVPIGQNPSGKGTGQYPPWRILLYTATHKLSRSKVPWFETISSKKISPTSGCHVFYGPQLFTLFFYRGSPNAFACLAQQTTIDICMDACMYICIFK